MKRRDKAFVETRWPPDGPGITGPELERRLVSVQVLFCSPESLLASLFVQEERKKLLFLTGPFGSGKTTWCMNLIALANARSIRLGGLVSPPVFNDKKKVGIDLVEVNSVESHRLAQRQDFLAQGNGRFVTSLSTSRWLFDPTVLAWGNKILEQIGECDLFILDEIGPLELVHGQGFQAGLRQIEAGYYRLAVIVIRPGLLSQAKARWPHALVMDVSHSSGYPNGDSV